MTDSTKLIERLRGVGPVLPLAHESADLIEQQAARIAALESAAKAESVVESDFKNFHRLLCERFGYAHDEKDWKRDQLSLIEWVANWRDQFEFIDTQNHTYRRAMQKIMARLTDLLDEDHFAEIEDLVKGAGVEPPPADASVKPCMHVYQARARGVEQAWADVNHNGFLAALAMRSMEARILYTAPELPTQSLETLRDVIRCLRESGIYRDEEGESTNALQDLVSGYSTDPQSTAATDNGGGRDARQPIETATTDSDARPVNDIPATLTHDEGAIAHCSYCGRYSLDPKTLSNRQPTCECGKKHGWSGSFKKPGPDAKWSGEAPAALSQKAGE